MEVWKRRRLTTAVPRCAPVLQCHSDDFQGRKGRWPPSSALRSPLPAPRPPLFSHGHHHYGSSTWGRHLVCSRVSQLRAEWLLSDLSRLLSPSSGQPRLFSYSRTPSKHPSCSPVTCPCVALLRSVRFVRSDAPTTEDMHGNHTPPATGGGRGRPLRSPEEVPE